MDDEVKWITRNGVHIPITNNYMNDKIREKNNVFIDKDGKTYKIKRKEEKDKDVTYGHIGLSEKGKEKAWVEYIKLNNELADKDYKFNGAKYQISGIKVEENYRRKGLGTKLYKEIGKLSNYEEIKFGTLTEEGKYLVNSVAIITRKENDVDGMIYYGKIKE